VSDDAARLNPNDPDAGRRLLLCMSVSLDGFVARTDGVIALGTGLPLMHRLPEPQRLELMTSTAYPDRRRRRDAVGHSSDWRGLRSR
jgi:hypothetical protein